MTYTYACNSKACQPNWETQTMGGGWKTSCCHKCSNPECIDYKGGCTCELKMTRTDDGIVINFIKNSNNFEEE